jgi:hypothetical protein
MLILWVSVALFSVKYSFRSNESGEIHIANFKFAGFSRGIKRFHL